MVHLDIKPHNIVKFRNQHDEYRWKLIEFDCSRFEGQSISNQLTPAYASYEQANYAAQAKNTASAPKAAFSMDICALGWILWEIASSEHITYWTAVGIDMKDNDKVLAHMTSIASGRIDLQADTKRIFSGKNEASLAHLLTDMLQIQPGPSALKLLRGNYSWLSGGMPTLLNNLGKKIDTVS